MNLKNNYYEKPVTNMKEFYTKEGRLGTEIYVKDPKQGGYTAFFKDLPIVSEGNTIDEAQTNLWNAVFDILKSRFQNLKSLTRK